MKPLIDIVAKVLNIPARKINDRLTRDSAASWDSFNHLVLIAEIERALKIRFSARDVENIRSFKQLKQIVAGKKRS